MTKEEFDIAKEAQKQIDIIENMLGILGDAEVEVVITLRTQPKQTFVYKAINPFSVSRPKDLHEKVLSQCTHELGKFLVAVNQEYKRASQLEIV